ncbi:TM2 domain containing 1 (predicted), isoform CRA_b [Rattus norvegicus]|uniref:TM2 domain containing 1 (Predicted), isoform CRA_b n=1 Tax=Rattus norvegicus TaxID=10116 RepID=A6JRK4_RAT|nr:TM2 domain containing 1 (predicted), isoform CRA_b [Rattus norvegicus]
MAAAWPAGRASPAAGPPALLRTLWLVTVAAGHCGAAASGAVGGEETPKCEDLRVGQYICKEPKINDATQEPVNCTNYTAHGLLKFCTVGFCGIGSLIDFVLISMQIVGPSDGSSYIIDYYGTRLTRLSVTNETFRKTQLYP